MARGKTGGKPGRPHDVLPPIFVRGGYWAIDLRRYGAGRPTMRDPRAAGWPHEGERVPARHEDIARRWQIKYADAYEDERRRRLLGSAPRARPLIAARDAYLDYRDGKVRHGTWAAERTALLKLVEHFGEKATTAELDAERMQAMVDQLIRSGYKTSTLWTWHGAWGRFMAWLGLPRLKLDLPELPDPDVRAWTDAEVQRIRAAADEIDRTKRAGTGWPSARMLVELGLATGGRQEELFALRWHQLNREDRSVRFTHQLDRRTRKLVPLKGGNARMALVLDNWWTFHREDADGFVLANPDGGPLSVSRQRSVLERVLGRAGTARGQFYHSLRHTYARVYLERHKGSLEELQVFLGHESISTTKDYYGHFSPSAAHRSGMHRVYGGIRAVP
ncbi:MAG TPA: site-specific integrase [Trueperaceae bacterium]